MIFKKAYIVIYLGRKGGGQFIHKSDSLNFFMNWETIIILAFPLVRTFVILLHCSPQAFLGFERILFDGTYHSLLS